MPQLAWNDQLSLRRKIYNFEIHKPSHQVRFSYWIKKQALKLIQVKADNDEGQGDENGRNQEGLS